ncbi:SIR2 family NAD-dependent protein deacylase [Gordonia rhizosphera]|uniref:NAD-dependent protein deacylase n=1 Tax=Gordonia rhizosphera NBRC 16068 TaxID=1108045 RepID=K6VYJ9_9ACTN|nr:NAD-dependent deacylase [Gordonia rhizosphera]GAB91980.1 NAD-dependent deacetylase [Gordonia rhizosphera NBRC 16068]
MTGAGRSELDLPAAAVDIVRSARWVTVFSGAGMSAESGIATFRDAETGLWERYDPAQLATPEAWEADPALVWAWYQWRARLVRDTEPNAGHHALAALAADRAVMVVTQNVDDLHERAGSDVVSHLHGSLFAPRCSHCGRPYRGTDVEPDRAVERLRVEPPMCPHCLAPVRPGVVWFGEPLSAESWSKAENAFAVTDVVIVVGTSGIVYPAAGLPERALARGVPVIEFNPEPSALSDRVTHSVRASAALGLPALLEAVRAGR